MLSPTITVPHNRLTHSTQEEQAVARVVRSGRWAGGAELAQLERRLARVAGVADAVGVGSGVGALRLSLLALGVGPGDSVAVPAYSCVALPNAVLACGAEPVPVDVSPDTWTISVAALRAILAVQPRLKAVIAVHTFGCLAPVRELAALGVPVVEDCSHAFGHGSFGRLGRISMLSLYATKLLGAGEGGMIFTNDTAVADHVRASRDYVDQAPSAHRLNDKLTDLAAALALCQLDRLPRSLARRAELAQRYTEQLAACAAGHDCVLPVVDANRVWYRYTVAVPDAAYVVASLAAQGIAAARPVENWGGATSASAPLATRAYDQLVSLPLYPTLTEAEQHLVCAAFVRALSVACPA